MRYILKRGLIVCAVVLFAACNSADKKHDMSAMHKTPVADSSGNKNVKEIAPTFATVDAKTASAIAAAIDRYLEVKNALAAGEEAEAKEAGKELYAALAKIDRSTLTEEQRKVYGSEEEDLMENAEHIGKSKLDHQRMHFSILSQSIYVIARSFGGGKPLYHLFCQKAENGDGAMWLSDRIDSNNPYSGTTNCSEVIEKIK